MIEKIWILVSTHYHLRSNNIVLVIHLSDRHTFLDFNLAKI